MRVDSIEINNFGSYEGVTTFDTYNKDSNKNIVLIGGKNGAGKTTLFTAIRLCIYGHRAFGYQSINPFYIRNLYKLINNNAKFSLPTYAYVKIDLTINNGIGNDEYILNRTWTCEKISSVSEQLYIVKNGVELSKSEISDFEKFITQIIPPELFNLYFFDGEKIADFFLDEGGNDRFKNAFLVLCGYDTFDIMNKNFHRVSTTGNSKSSILIDEYLSAKTNFANKGSLVENYKLRIRELINSIETIEANILALDSDYKKSGGVTQEEWNNKFNEIKKQELLREEKNAWLKRIANDVLPFLILREQLIDVQNQINKEERMEKAEYFLAQFKTEDTKALFSHAFQNVNITITPEQLENIFKYVSIQIKINQEEPLIFRLSPDQKAAALYTISNVLEFDEKNIAKEVITIKNSIKESQIIREELELCNIETVSLYMEKRNVLLAEKDNLIEERFTLEEMLKNAENDLIIAESNYTSIRKRYEETLKSESINDIAAKAIMMLDKLQERLYTSQITKMKSMFHVEVNTLIRKSKFIDSIEIDDKFNIHIYKNDIYTGEQLSKMLTTYGFDKLALLLGQKAVDKIKEMNLADLNKPMESILSELDSIILPVEVDKNSLSNGEKQIFIMALYKALMQLCNHEVPFVIDTPFARIDTEHRHNIVKHFFCKLRGQVFIFSTNEEIDQTHIELMEDNLLRIYTLKNDDNSQTTVIKSVYFGEV